jgi:hypothetical protein
MESTMMPQDAEVDVALGDELGVGGQLEARLAPDVRILVAAAHRSGIRSCRGVAVVAHLDLDGVHDRVIAAVERREEFPVLLGLLRLVIHQQRAGGVGRQHAEPLEREAVSVRRGRGDVVARHRHDDGVRRIRRRGCGRDAPEQRERGRGADRR